MSHQVESMFSVRETPWHGLGVVLENPPTVAEGMRQAGLTWDVGLRPMYVRMPDNSWVKAQHRAVYRKDTGAVLGEVGPRYTPLRNHEKFAWFQPFVQAGLATLETAGSLAGGAKTWVLAKLSRPDSEVVPGDAVAKFLMLSDSYDGSQAVRVGFTPVRVVCANTLAAAHGDRASRLLRVRHTKSLGDNLADLRGIVNAADAEFEATAAQFRTLARRGVSPADLKRYVTVVLGLTEKDGKLSTRAKNVLADVLARFEGGPGADLPGVRGTYWGAYNAVTEYLSYGRGKDREGRLESLWFGSAAGINQRAFETALGMAG